ncbi:hypothetical protein C0075_23890, partial [Rhizobium sp. KAs_5_22]
MGEGRRGLGGEAQAEQRGKHGFQAVIPGVVRFEGMRGGFTGFRGRFGSVFHVEHVVERGAGCFTGPVPGST